MTTPNDDEVQAAPDDLEKYLDEWDEGRIARTRVPNSSDSLRELAAPEAVEKPQEEGQPAEQDEFDKYAEELRQEEAQEQAADYYEQLAEDLGIADVEGSALELQKMHKQEQEDADHLIGLAKQEVPSAEGLPNEYLYGLLKGAYESDLTLQEAWDNRHEDPEQAASRLVPHLQTIVDYLDSARRSENKQLIAAMRGARSVPARPSGNGFAGLDFSKMSDAEYRATKEAVFAAASEGRLRS